MKEIYFAENWIVHETEKFISDEECDELIEFAKPLLSESLIKGGEKNVKRQSQTAWLTYKDSPIVRDIQYKICEKLLVPLNILENLQIIRYQPGGHYITHYDFYTSNNEQVRHGGGQRMFTNLINLNDDFEGGETEFPQMGKVCVPKKGKMITWRNALTTSLFLPQTEHSGNPVKSGTKWAAVQWVRQFPFERNDKSYWERVQDMKSS